MKKIALIGAMICCSSAFLQAQSFQKGTNVVSASIGFGSALGGFGYGTQTPAISLQLERGIWEAGPGVVSLGAYAGTKRFSYSAGSGSYYYKQKWDYTVIGIRGAYHYSGLDIDKLDVYAGAMLSYNILKYKYEDETGSNLYNAGSYGNAAGLTGFVGGRYYFMPALAVHAELGYGVSYLSTGLSLKF